MTTTLDEDGLLRSVALENARAILLARQRAEQELVRAKAALERQTRELSESLERLRRSEQELSDFFENASVGLHWVGPDGMVLRVNRVELELLGYRREEYVGRHIAEFHVDRDVIDDILRRLAAGETIRDREARMRCKDGSIRHVLIDSSVMYEDGRFVHTRCFTRDITDRKRVEEAQARLAAIVESSEDAIIGKALDSTTRILSWNAGAERLLGYRPEEAIGQSILLIIPPERHDEERSILERLRRGERLEHYDSVRVAKDGRRIDVSLTISPVRDRDGRVVAAATIARDISAKKRTEQTSRFLADASAMIAELTDYESTLHRVASLAVTAFSDWCAVDLQQGDGSVKRLAVTHSDPDKVEIAREIFRRYPPRPSDARGVMKMLRSGRTEWAAAIPDSLLREMTQDEEHFRAVRKLGLKSFICVPLRSGGRTIGALSFGTAESGRVFDSADVAAAEDLAHRAAIAIENATLLARLREADRRKDEFLAMLAHELRNPLAPISTAAQIWRSKAPPVSELRWATDVVDRQVQQMARLVDDLLDVSRISRGKVELRKERLELATVVSSALDTSRPLVEKWGHELAISIPPEPIFLDADLTRLAQVLSNLLNNAAKYTDHGGRISLTAEPQDGHVLIRVQDNGMGIPPEMLSSIFDMFTQVDRTLERSEGGLGIGLTLVQRLVELHGGSVEARSEGPGKGSEFLVRLPLAAEVESPRPASGEAEERRAPVARRILVVDDNRDAADSLGMLLRMNGHEVQTAHDGLEAVGAAATFRPEIVLLDIGLPKLNGYEVARRIRERETGRDVVLVALTGWGQEEDRRRSSEAGFDYHLTKPVELDALKRLLAAPSRRWGATRPPD